MISVQTQDFSLAEEYQALTQGNQTDGAVVTFVGLVRDFNQGNQVLGLSLEHYPGMTEKALAKIVQQARAKWDLGRVRLIHRVGDLHLSEQIVFVGVSSKHRKDAFDAAEFIMDYLKNDAPFWKKELTDKGPVWVAFNDKDKAAKAQWTVTS
ncbi:molybdopterin synthase catalytic subunit MoaE [Catenovulum sp. SM1970]|uniref:molybdopterin synthase catalytic subunit MoaE n=1 Tax=Marinifaba aquimaris TaxID=2741323 RepID=UPI0015740A6D|nr:molybdopterin synthase catalytic subunit MoaE [Marinifaba aquimaris]